MKNKNNFFMLSIALLLSTPLWQSCEKTVLLEENSDQHENVDTQVRLTFQLFTPSVSRATSIQDFKKIWIMDVYDNTTLQVIEQNEESTAFGTPTLTLAQGVHTLHFFATDADNGKISNGVIQQNPLGDSFYKSVTLDTRKATGTQRVVLEREVGKIVYTGEGATTLKGILTDFQLSKGLPGTRTQDMTLNTNDTLLTFVSAQSQVTMGNGTQVPVKKNGITIIKINGGNETPIVPPKDEVMILETDTALFYLAKEELKVSSLEKIPNPRETFREAMSPYRIPTKREAYSLNKRSVPDDYWSGTRCLCYDSPRDAGSVNGEDKFGTGAYYTFKWNNESSITLAGERTAYCIKPIRTVPVAPVSLPTSIDADFTWDTDTTVVN